MPSRVKVGLLTLGGVALSLWVATPSPEEMPKIATTASQGSGHHDPAAPAPGSNFSMAGQRASVDLRPARRHGRMRLAVAASAVSR
jgi:hypothetical protein